MRNMWLRIAYGGFRTSLITDNVQGASALILLVICGIGVGVTSNVTSALIQSTELLGASLLGWQLIYILPVAIIFNDFFLAVCVPVALFGLNV